MVRKTFVVLIVLSLVAAFGVSVVSAQGGENTGKGPSDLNLTTELETWLSGGSSTRTLGTSNMSEQIGAFMGLPEWMARQSTPAPAIDWQAMLNLMPDWMLRLRDLLAGFTGLQ
ncbi:MAG: hypothetical protein JW910_10605 [Anaerolineae bacterium]|nr:hypothetical protein [Anaerolineae bacterium]